MSTSRPPNPLPLATRPLRAPAARPLSWSVGISLGVHLAAFGAALWWTLATGDGAGRSVPAIGYVAAADPAEDRSDAAEPEHQLVAPDVSEPRLVEQEVAVEALDPLPPEPQYVASPLDQRAIASQLALRWRQDRGAPVPRAGGETGTPVASEPAQPVAASAVVAPAPEPVVVAARLVTHADPEYPRISRRLDEQGTVTVRIDVGADGTVRSVELVASSGHQRLDRAALDAIVDWRFEPATSDGRPIRWSLDHRVTFTLR